MKHLTDEQLSAYMDGAFKGRDAEEAGRHLADCQPCREALAELAEQDQSLKPALMHDPGEEYFERFAARVEERIRTVAPAAASPARRGFDFGHWFRSPRALAWAGAAAVVIVGGGVALMTSREVIVPAPWDREPADKVERAAPGSTTPAAPAAPHATGQQEAVTPPPVADDAQRAPSSDGVMSSPGAPVEEAPVVTSGREGAAAPLLAKSRADAPAPSTSAVPAPEVRQASPGRAVEVRRNEAGEEVPVRRLGAMPAAPAPAPAPARGADEISRVRKKLAAEPMERLSQREQGALSRDAFAEGEARLCGDVRDAADRPVAGAQVALTDLGRTATTDATGRFCMRAPQGEHALSVMAVGYRESRQVVRVAGAEADARVILAAVAVLDPKGGSFAGRAKDDYGSLPEAVRGMVREAQQLEAEAAAMGSATRFESAASAWGRVLPRVARGPLETETRRHVAETRFRAWETGPNASRARAAATALTAYLKRAPAGPGRDQAVRWLDRVSP